MVLNLKENQTLRGLVRDYLGSRSSSEFFDNVDDFLKSMHDLYNYDSKEVIVKLHRKLQEQKIDEPKDFIEDYDIRMVHKLRNFSLLKDKSKTQVQDSLYKKLFKQKIQDNSNNPPNNNNNVITSSLIS